MAEIGLQAAYPAGSVAVIGAAERGREVAAYRDGKRVRFEWAPLDELTRLE
jgi:hypothetical protein